MNHVTPTRSTTKGARTVEDSTKRIKDELKKTDVDIGKELATGFTTYFAERGETNYMVRLWGPTSLAERILDKLVATKGAIHLDLACWLALKGDHRRAGAAYRIYLTDLYLVRSRELLIQARKDVSSAKMTTTKVGQQLEKLTMWEQIGLKLRKAERGRPMSNLALAKKIAKKTGHSVNSIRAEIPALDLGKNDWERGKRIKSSDESP